MAPTTRRCLTALAAAACCLPSVHANGYQDTGPGTCTAGGLPVASQVRVVGLSKSECEAKCTADQGCFGYAHTFSKDCILYSQGPLSGGGTQERGSHCIIKSPPPMPLAQEVAGVPAQPTASSGAKVTQYTNEGPGVCTFAGHSPQANFYSQVGAEGCEAQCTASAECYGFSSTESGDCKLFTQGPLAGGGEQWDDAQCFVKSPQPARQTGRYQDAGAGSCAWQELGADCDTTAMPGVAASDCAAACSKDPECSGYSSQADSCLVFKHCPLSGGGRPWGYAHCHIKMGWTNLLFP